MIARLLVALAALTLAASAPVEGARVFEPGLISGPENDFALAIAPHASVLLFTRGVDGRSFILQSHNVVGRWTSPKTAPFSGRWIDLEPAWSPDGSFVVFASNRPHDGGARALTARYYGKEQTGGALWRVDYTASRWGTPRRLAEEINRGGSVWTPTIAGDGALYYMTTDLGTGRFRLYRAEHAYGDRPHVRELAFSDGAHNDVDPFVTPDQSHLIFSSDRNQATPAKNPGPERLFIAFNPRSKDPLVCAMKVEGFDDPTVSMVEARLSPDLRTLYFASRRLAHAEGETAKGDWDDGKANIWETPFTPALWRFDGASLRCRKAR
jgi:hypothetical protein